jgi:hypothetical protein
MSECHDKTNEPLHHVHECCNLFGCGDEKGTGVFREDIKDAAFAKPSADRLFIWMRWTRRRWTLI